MSYLADAHRDWHTVNGKYAVCDLDCGVTEYLGDAFEDDWEATEHGTKGIRCWACKGRHASPATVKLCHEVKRDRERSRDPYAEV